LNNFARASFDFLKKEKMKAIKSLKLNFYSLILFLILISLPAIAQQNQIVGNWQGALKISSIQLRIVFNVIETENQKISAALDSPDQGAFGIPVDTVIFNPPYVKFEVTSIAGFFEGNLNETAKSISGKWNQGGQSFDLELSRSDSAITINRPQEPKPPFPYIEEEVVFDNYAANITLAGTLTYPKEGGNFPVVILVSGSGPQNRNEELLGHKPFLVIADFLTRNGIAVLRYDDRGVGKSTGDFSSATTVDFVGDALSAVDFLKSKDQIIKNQIGIIGHSEGGLIAPLAAVQSEDVAFIIMMAGPGLRGKEILVLQTELILRANGEPEDEIKKGAGLNEQLYGILLSDKDSASVSSQLRDVFERAYNEMTDKEKTQIGDKDIFMERQFSMMQSPWFKYFLAYDPYETLTKVSCPVLAVNGGKDLQVPPKENLAMIEKAFKEASKENYKLVELPGLNHLFQTAKTGSPMEYSTIEETISPAALNVIKDWILETTK
jgi:pimeloyl-ACP methyl ester carboxylesterase